MLFKSLPLCLLLLILEVPVLNASLFPRAFHSIHGSAVRRTHSLARDLRVAFGGVLVPRDDTPSQNTRVVYCKPSRQGTPGGNSTSPSPSPATLSPGPISTSTKTTAGSLPTGSTPASSPWQLLQAYDGQDFFNGWDFFTLGDPTHGIVDYIDENTARSNGLLEVNAQGNAVMRVETTPSVPANRKSIRIQTKQQINGGLVIMDSVHMPTGCGTWPAFWTNGPNWPDTGEIDIVEGVHDYTNNQATIHTNVGCTIASTSSAALSISGNVIGGTDCAALTTGNQGCGIRANTGNSFGSGFNANGGGVYAMKWDANGINVYFFPRGSEPADITAGSPQPDSWGTPQARWAASTCNPFEFFRNHSAIFDTTLCGDWAGAVWGTSGIPGQEQSCAQRTGFPTCEAFVQASGSSFDEAYWEVKSVKIYQSK